MTDQHKKLKVVLPFMVVVVLIIIFLYFIFDLEKKVGFIGFGKSKMEFSTYSFHNIQQKRFDFLQIITTSRDCVDGVALKNEYYVITGGGLLKINAETNQVEKYTANNGLLSHDLTDICQVKDRIFISTAGNGLIQLKGNSIYHFNFDNPQFNYIQCLHSSDGKLYAGGDFEGLIVLRGNSITREITGIKNEVSVIFSHPEGQLIVGTTDGDLYFVNNERIIEKLDSDDGLPKGKINDIAFKNNNVLVTTNYGIFSVSREYQVQPLVKGVFAKGFIEFNKEIFAFTYSGDIINLGDNTRSSLGIPINGAFADDAGIYYCTHDGVLTLKKKIYNPANEITGNFITTISIDEEKSVICGTFENGIFRLNDQYKFANSQYSEILRQVNHAWYDKSTGLTYIATTDGLVLSRNDQTREILTEKEGLISNYISYSLRDGDRIYCATGKGLAIIEKGIIKNLYAFHGLVNNHVYTLATFNNKLYIGTLGGISVMENDRIINSYTVSNSDLTVNWITSLLKVDNELWIGTYGGGVFKMDLHEKISKLKLDINDLEINNNALYFDGNKIFVGTLDNGFYVIDKETNRFVNYSSLLPSRNVTAITESSGKILLGTEKGFCILDKECFNK